MPRRATATVEDFDGLGFPIAVSTDALKAIPPMLPDVGGLMTLWRADKGSARIVVTHHHVGIDLKPVQAEAASFSFERLYANPKELPA